MSVNIIELDKPDEEDEGFKAFIETLKTGNTEAVFLITKEDGTMSVGSTARNSKDLIWDIHRLTHFMNLIAAGDLD